MVTVVFISLSVIGTLGMAATYLTELVDTQATRYTRVKGAFGGLVCIGLAFLLMGALFTQPVEKPLLVTTKPAVHLTGIASK